ncbi:Acyl protein synthase/acyl-CoA reductase RfbN [hydrothermal vent metagenome]|uniref:Acyl protein synthase/acyl-CoA reductase RfbN n=1 Tax=hydrothermal vent metagenome TaxID=652676 RepID=A0A3B0WKC3_9ZZZZ
MTELDALFKLDPYSISHQKKNDILLEHLSALHEHHLALCEPYCQMAKSFGSLSKKHQTLADFFYMPVQIFKHYELKSIAADKFSKTLTSSGTTSAQVSKIFLDKDTTRYQTKALSSIMRSYLGAKRLPMIIVDTESVIKDRKMFSARGGGIIGMSNFGRNHLYLFDEKMKIRHDELLTFLKEHEGEEIFLFGFTFMVWQHLIRELENSNETLDLSGAILVHSGGWKKLEQEKVDNATFKKRVKEVTGINRIYNFYGMVEQMGSVYMECEKGHLHASLFSDVIVRDVINHKVLPSGQVGIIETLSILPYSYPGHAILTEDQGIIHGIDDCECGRKGTHFSIIGRLPKAEVRGCSDTYEAGA